MRNLLLFVFIFSIAFINAQNQTKDSLRTDSLIIRSYPVIIVDSPNAFYTMEQFNQDYLSGYRYFSIESMKKFGSKHTRLIQLFSSLVTIPLTHEEGHRSILTSQNIGAISRPIVNSKGAAYVMGVSDSTLKNLRQNNLPTYMLGRCTVGNSRTIEINQSWLIYNNEYIEQTVAHELGHCLLNRRHFDNYASIMNTYVFSPIQFRSNRVYYYNELFGNRSLTFKQLDDTIIIFELMR